MNYEEAVKLGLTPEQMKKAGVEKPEISESYQKVLLVIDRIKDEIENPVDLVPPRLGDLPIEKGIILSYEVSEPREVTLLGKKITRRFITFKTDNENMAIISTFLQSIKEVITKDLVGMVVNHHKKWEVKLEN